MNKDLELQSLVIDNADVRLNLVSNGFLSAIANDIGGKRLSSKGDVIMSRQGN